MKMRRFLGIFITVVLFLLAMGNFIFSQYRLQSSFQQTQERLMLITANAALSIDVEALQKVPLVQRGEGTPEYQAITQKLIAIKKINPTLKYVYIMTATDQPGILQYVVDADPLPQIITAGCSTALHGDKYDARELPDLINAYDRPTADRKVTTDEWGTFISGYAPIQDVFGKTVGILGVDTDAAWVGLMQKKINLSGRLALGTGFLFLLSFIIPIIRRRAIS
ncbi:MAG: hypothetical protein NTX01_01865 [Candidatus Omnitrophica bacterium]|nr:hypothetical protein [Candidatus Omnitrophota bacterium]